MIILHIPAWYPHDKDPLLGTFVKRHILSLTPLGKQVVIFVRSDTDQKEKYIYSKREDKGIVEYFASYRKCSEKNIFKVFINPIRFFKAHHILYQKFCSEYGKNQITHVHVLTRGGFVAWLIKKRFKTPYVISEHWSRYNSETGNYHGAIRKLLTKIVVKSSSAVLPVTYDLKKVMLKRGLKNSNYRVIGNVVDVDIFNLGNIQYQEKKRFIHVSTFCDSAKNITGMLRVVKRLSEKRDDFIFDIIGKGEDGDYLKDYAANLGILDDSVRFLGPMDMKEVADTMKDSMFLLMFSNYENMPVVISEAMACGKPVISTDVGGISEVVDDECGVLVTPRDEDSLLKAIEAMIKNYQNYNQDNIRKKAIKLFSHQNIGAQITAVYKTTLKKNA